MDDEYFVPRRKKNPSLLTPEQRRARAEAREESERQETEEKRKAREKAFDEYRAQFKHTQTHLFGDNDHWIPPRDPLMIFFGSEDGKAIDRVDENGRLFFGHRPVSAAHVEQYWEHLREMRLDDPEAFKRLCARYQHIEDAYIEKLKDRADRRRERREKWEAKREHVARKIRLTGL
ncbi:hypothetical protein [Tabrizicola caldifontis]|uniref:hypothetical protein n=1 Tax=Tabrizicola caldifontis TaxID=2528036 RepID=UPI0010814178|nr:hypothetical protein [Rhodobacter sp. YIM 73028]